MFRMMSSAAMSTIARQLKQVSEKVTAAGLKRPEKLQYVQPRLVAVSKTKGVDMIVEAYDAGQRHFGENYVVELIDKANDIELQDRCDDIKWHFIGHLQRNKVSKLLDIPNLFVVETIDSERLAKAVNDAWVRQGKQEPLNIMVQVNTSGEENKSGCAVGETAKLVGYIRENCPKLNILGLMTIGAYDYNPMAGPNPDFQALFQIREEVCKAHNIPIDKMELSMGMSSDFEQAIELGSTNVRVGSTIFGARSKPQSSSEENATPAKSSQGTVNSAVDNMTEASLPSEQIQNLALS
ncbi:pyridoxal phosphate homeostasis protein [Aplysia californica]|uniref:Pyridoxal phosphate homeostasis protein n=1 Tax=Aplysia californica TaxID=6500 RepID=A0ABM0JFS6_APLCA|nr:pyridoxal phosphate homeostasis protein [Aplysia californica]XP_012934839.1 pyridoxal phosphate homeostasis protein [Aplysia californica]